MNERNRSQRIHYINMVIISIGNYPVTVKISIYLRRVYSNESNKELLYVLKQLLVSSN